MKNKEELMKKPNVKIMFTVYGEIYKKYLE